MVACGWGVGGVEKSGVGRGRERGGRGGEGAERGVGISAMNNFNLQRI